MFIATIIDDLGQSAIQTGEKFGFTWPLFLSNVVSFLLVCWLLQRFAYKPILAVLEKRRSQIAQSLDNVEKIKEQLATAEQKHTEILTRANAEAQKMIDEARSSAEALRSARQQQAVADAEIIIQQAREAVTHERDQMFTELRHEVARLVVETTGKVAGKVLTDADQRRLNEEAAKEVFPQT